MERDPRTITLELAGARYRMRTDTDEAHLLHLAELVNERVESLGPKAARSATPAQLMAIVALSLAEDLESERTHREALEGRTREAIRELVGHIESRLAQIERETPLEREAREGEADASSATGSRA